MVYARLRMVSTGQPRRHTHPPSCSPVAVPEHAAGDAHLSILSACPAAGSTAVPSELSARRTGPVYEPLATVRWGIHPLWRPSV